MTTITQLISNNLSESRRMLEDFMKNPAALTNIEQGANLMSKALLGGKKITKSAAPFESDIATLKAIDPNLGVKGLPQSATGQAVLLTGINIPAELGYHYGPKPHPEGAHYLNGQTIFSKTINAGKKTALLNAYPPRYFDGIDSGKRLYSSIPLALTNAGIPLFTEKDY